MIPLLLLLSVLAQQLPPGVEPLPPAPGTTNPRSPVPTPATTSPSPSDPRTTSPAPGPQTTAATDDALAHAARVIAPAGLDASASALSDNAILLGKQAEGAGDWLVTRDRKQLIDQPQVKDLNDQMRLAGLAIWAVVLGLVLLKHILGPFVGADPMGIAVAFPVALFFGMLGWFNQPILGIIIDVVRALLGVIANAPIKAAIDPVLHPGAALGLITGPVVSLFAAIVSILLILKLWAQVGWLMVFGAAAPLYITTTQAPLLGRYGAAWWRSWFGTLIDPILLLLGLKLVAAMLSILSGLPDPFRQLLSAFVLLGLLAIPGFHAGAYGGNGVDWLVGLAAYRVMGAFRGVPHYQPAMASAGGGALPPPAPPNNPFGVSGQNTGSGGGTAVSWWKSGKWKPK